MTMLDERPVDQLDRPSPWSNAALSSAAEIGRWRLAARLARREIRRRPWRTLLVVLLIGVPVAGFVVADVGYRSSNLPPDQSHRFGTAAARLFVFGAADIDDVASSLPPDSIAVLGAEVSFLPLRSAANRGEAVAVDLSTLDMASPLAEGIARPSKGRLPAADDEVFLDERAAEAFGVSVGDTLQLVRPAQSFRVVGVGTADGYYRLMAAPGFDLSALRPDIAQNTALIDGPSFRDGSVGSGLLDAGSADGSFNVEYPEQPTTDHLALFLGWVFCILLMAVLGIIVSAAFAVSGRRQLVTIGQLSASGGDPAVLRRYLALQGTWSGLVGVLVGMAAGLALVPVLGDLIANDGRIDVVAFDLIVIAVVALTTATLAAIVPTKDLARTSVLAALGGRRPIAKVRPRQVRFGAMLVAGGLAALWLAVSSARDSNNNNGGNGLGAAVALAGAGGLAVLAGMCCVCPVIVDLVSRAGSKRRGATRLATRGLGRHRARSAALMAAIAAIGAAAIAAGATAEQQFADQRDMFFSSELDLVEVVSAVFTNDGSDAQGLGPGSIRPPVGPDLPFLDGSVEVDPAGGQAAGPQPVVVEQSVLDGVEAVVGPVDWYQATQVLNTEQAAAAMGGDLFSEPLLVADEGLLNVIGLTAGQRAILASVDGAMIVPSATESPSQFQVGDMFGGLQATVIQAETNRFWMVINPQAVERLGLDVVPAGTFGRLQHNVTRDQYDELTSQNVFTNESAFFVDVPPGELMTSINVGYPDVDYSTLARLIILGGMLLLTTVVVGVGMALWAAEGKDERDALVSIGAAPSVLARVVGLKAFLLAFVGGVIAVPLGFGTLRLVVEAAHEHTTFPWLVAAGVVIVVPILIGIVATVGSAIAQRVRPVRMSTLATD